MEAHPVYHNKNKSFGSKKDSLPLNGGENFKNSSFQTFFLIILVIYLIWKLNEVRLVYAVTGCLV